MNINLEYYKVFYHVANEKSITLAAKTLCISQPAVSQALKVLEEELGTELFIRTRKGVSLTDTGNVLYQHVKDGYETILQGEKKLSEFKDLDAGEIRIGASDMTLQYYLLPYLEKFHQLYPKIKVHVTNAPTPNTIEHLLANRIDFGIVSSPIIEDSRINIYVKRNISDIFIAGNKFLHLKDKTLTYKDLESLPTICLEKATSTRKYVDDFLEQNNVTLTPEFELATSNMIVQFVIKNFGIGSIMKDFATPYIESGEIFELKFDKVIPDRNICIVSNKRHDLGIAAKKMMDLL